MNLPEYPKVSLLGFVDDKIEPDTPAAVELLVTQLIKARDWNGDPPEFVDTVDTAGARTCGVVLWLTDMRAPGAAAELFELDRRELAETKTVIDALAAFSGRTGLTVGIEYGGDSAGWIDAGQPDEMIQEGLIGEWERRLAG